MTLTPEQIQSNEVIAHLKTQPELYDRAVVCVMIATDESKSPAIRLLAEAHFERIYNTAVAELGYQKPKYVWRNGARVRA